MYRIFCESYKNYINSFEDNNSRLRNAEPLELIVNIEKRARRNIWSISFWLKALMFRRIS